MSDLPNMVPPDDDIEVALLTLHFKASDPDELLALLSKYVVLTRNVTECRNVDLCASFTDASKFVVIEKWDNEDAARAHLDSDLMVDMAKGCDGILAAAPEIDLLEGVSAHDLA